MTAKGILVLVACTIWLLGAKADDFGCSSPQYLTIGTNDFINCSFGKDFYSLLWYSSADTFHSNAILTVVGSERSGSGFHSGKFNIYPNGSLIISNVTLNDENNFTAIVLETPTSDGIRYVVDVVIIAPTFSRLPLIFECDNSTEVCFQILNRNAEVSCIMTDARPAIPLSWKVRTNNGDLNVSSKVSVTNVTDQFFTSLVTTADFFTYSPFLTLLVCKADSPAGLLEKNESLILLQNDDAFTFADPVMKYVENGTRLELNCTSNKALYLTWQVKKSARTTFDHILFAFLVGGKFQSHIDCHNFSLNGAGDLVIDEVSTNHEGVYGCVSGNGVEDGVAMYNITVFVFPDPARLAVDECDGQQYCVLEKEPTGTLTCAVTGIRPQVELDFIVPHDRKSQALIFHDKHSTTTVHGGIFDISLTSKYRLNDVSRTRVTVECKVMTSIARLNLSTRLDVVFSSSTTTSTGVVLQSNERSRKWLLCLIALPLLIILTALLWRTRRRHRCKADSLAEETKIPMTEMEETAEKKTQFLKELQYKYGIWCGEVQPPPFLHDKYDLDKLFVPSGIEYLEVKHGDKEKWTMLRDYKTVFSESKIKLKRSIIDGEPGYGKSTLALRIAQDWCKGVAPMNAYDIVILLRLRQFRNVPSIYSAIKRFLLPKDSRLTVGDIKNILDSSSTLVLLDGYDEYPDREKEDAEINLIIKGEMCQEYEVVLTTRTSYVPPTHINTTIKRFRLTGFDDDSRETYIRNLVSLDSPDDADTVITFPKEDPVLADLCKIPLFFAMISFKRKISAKFRTFTTVTEFFRHIIICFHSHKQLKTPDKPSGKELDHSKLDEVAFEGLSGDTQQISWGKNKLMDKIGKDLYEEYVSIGILIEGESFDCDTLEFNTETRFFHKLFAEWYAANHFAKVASQPETELEPWPVFHVLWRYVTKADTCHPHTAANSNNVQSLKNLHPKDVPYMYRYACGLNPEAAVKIIKHLAKNPFYAKYALLCRTEWGGSFETIQDTARLLCSRTIEINDTDSLLLQQSTIKLLNFASSRKIPLVVLLYNCLSIGSTGNLRVQPSNLSLPVNDTSIRQLLIVEPGRVITEEEIDSVLQYAAKCRGLKELEICECLLPQYVKKTDSLSVFTSKKVKVKWFIPVALYHLNLSSCRWEYYWDDSPITDEQYQEAVEKVRQYAEWRKQGHRVPFNSYVFLNMDLKDVIPSPTFDDKYLMPVT